MTNGAALAERPIEDSAPAADDPHAGMRAREHAIESLHGEIAAVCGHLNVLHHRLAALVARALDDGAWEQWGIRSPEHWLAWQTGLSPARARQLVGVARRLVELPVCAQAFANGELAVDQMVAIADHARPHHDGAVCELARSATVSQLRHALAHYHLPDEQPDPPRPVSADQALASATGPTATATGAGPTDIDATHAIDATDAGVVVGACASVVGDAPVATRSGVSTHDDGSYLMHGYTEAGRYRLHLECDALDGAVVEQALADAHDHLFRHGQPGASAVDALVEVARRALTTTDTVARRDLFRTYVHLSTEYSDAGHPSTVAWINAGPRLPAALADLLLCDGTLQPLWHTAGTPINVGRTRRTVPPHTRRAVLDRDRTCRHPTCTTTRHLDVHHLDHWANRTDAGTDTHNLIALCPYHHRAHHRGAFTITGNADQPETITFHDALGRTMRTGSKPTPPTEPPPGPPPGHHYRHPLGEPLQTRWLTLPDPPIP